MKSYRLCSFNTALRYKQPTQSLIIHIDIKIVSKPASLIT